MKDFRDRNVIKQRFDYSCGSAALATLLHYGFGDTVDERDVLAAVFDTLSDDDASQRRKDGLSLLDLQRVAQSRGYRAQGFRLLPEHLPLLRGPVIVFIKPFGYEHFAVLRGTKGDRVFLADPSRGNLRQPAYRFLDDWLDESGKGVVFVVEPMDGLPTQPSPLAVPAAGSPQPELMTVRQLLFVGSPPARPPIREGLERPRF
jgi:predicted double-glycine peptidase